MNILVTGSISYDRIMDFPHEFKDYFHPKKLHQINISFVVDKLEKQFGGTATNIAYNCGIANQYLKSKNKIMILSSVGKDGKFFMDFFKNNKIDTEGILIDKTLYSAYGTVITDTRDNQIWGFYYGANQKGKNIKIKKHLGRENLLVISANHPLAFMNFQKQAIKYKVPYLYDPGMAMTWIKDKDLLEGIMNCRYFIGNDYEVAMITKRLRTTVAKLVHEGINVITTLGEDGVIYEGKINNKNIKLEQSSYKVKKVIDPTGAGDAWRGGFVAGISTGLKLRESLKMGNVMASFAIEKYGTANHTPKKFEIEKRFKSL